MGIVSLSFLFLFLPAVYLVFVLIKPRYANVWLLLASLSYIGLAAPAVLPLLLLTVLIAYIAGIGNGKIGSLRGKQIISASCILLLLAVLALIRIRQLPGHVLRGISWPAEMASLGASFYILQAVMYIADTYKGEEEFTNPLDLALYLSFFPKLVSGPLVPYRQFREKIGKECRTPGTEAVTDGIWRIAAGICKKVLIADNLAALAGTVFDMSVPGMSVLQTWLGVIAYTLQLYLDFSGYSDIAIGMGMLFGYEFPENFRYPYAADSLKEFWRRWHISLSRFFRDYIYIPLGGNRKGRVRWVLSLMAVWVMTGLWHGLTWNYMIWGLGHGILLLAEGTLVKRKEGKTGRRVLGHVYTLLAVMLLWVVFRTGDPASAGKILLRLFGIGAGSFADAGFLFQLKNAAPVLLLGILCCIPPLRGRFCLFKAKVWYKAASVAVLAAGVIASIACLYLNSYQPFLYSMF